MWQQRPWEGQRLLCTAQPQDGKRWGRNGPWGLHKHKQITRDQINTEPKVQPMEESKYPIDVKMHERCHCSETGKVYCFSQFWKDRNFPQVLHLPLDRNILFQPPHSGKHQCYLQEHQPKTLWKSHQKLFWFVSMGHSLRLSLKSHIQLLVCMTRNKCCFLKKKENRARIWSLTSIHSSDDILVKPKEIKIYTAYTNQSLFSNAALHKIYLIASPVHGHSPSPPSPPPSSAQHKQSNYTHHHLHQNKKKYFQANSHFLLSEQCSPEKITRKIHLISAFRWNDQARYRAGPMSGSCWCFQCSSPS